jgi:hypothetical protein
MRFGAALDIRFFAGAFAAAAFFAAAMARVLSPSRADGPPRRRRSRATPPSGFDAAGKTSVADAAVEAVLSFTLLYGSAYATCAVRRASFRGERREVERWHIAVVSELRRGLSAP